MKYKKTVPSGSFQPGKDSPGEITELW